MIELNSVSKSFGNSLVLNNLSFTVPEGKTYALLGLSGSGKTTALKLLSGLYYADQGSVRVQGIDVLPKNINQVRKLIGQVIQDGGLFPHLSAYENVAILGQELKWSKDKIRLRIDELLQLTQLTSTQLERYPRQLSGGQRQRVGIMRALLTNPPILLLDEPLGALDPITRFDLQNELKELCEKLKKTTLLVTHDLFEAGHLAHSILLLRQGKILQQGNLLDLLKNPVDLFVKKFVESQRHSMENVK